MRRHWAWLSGCVVILSACSNPEEAAEKALTSAQADWANARKNLDPQKRASALQKIIADVENVGEKYNKTQLGQAVVAGRAAGGVSISDMKREHDRIAERASCYAKPSVECLEPFASSGYKYQSANAGSAENAVQTAAKLVCEKNFSEAETALQNLKINRPVYAANLVQVALAGAQCDKPEAVKAAATAWLEAEPSQGASRVSALQQLLNNEGLRDSWPILLPELEKAATDLPENQAAGVDLTLSARYAALGDADTALAKFRRVTDELGYTVDINTRLEVVSSLIATGHADAGLSLFDGQPNNENLRMGALHFATQELGGRLGVVRPDGAATANVPYNKDLTEFFAPVTADDRKRENAIAADIEAKLDEFVAGRQPNGQYLGMSGVDAAYARLALIQQKLGDSNKANALVEKSAHARQAMSPTGAYRADAQTYAAEYEVLVALGQSDADKAAALLPQVAPTGNDIAELVLRALAKAGKAEEALTLATQINRAGANMYQTLINELGSSGHVAEAEQVLNAFPGDSSTKSAIAWGLVENAAAAGKMKEVEKLAESYSLLDVPAYKLRMVELRADQAIAKNDRKKAEAEIREMFSIGEEFDKMAAAERASAFYAENAARKAFGAGYIDLGVELYNSASHKDQRPFFDAFSKNTNRPDYPRILMTAHDNLQGEELSYVIDAAIRGLNGET
jgi:hypothetical protein